MPKEITLMRQKYYIEKKFSVMRFALIQFSTQVATQLNFKIFMVGDLEFFFKEQRGKQFNTEEYFSICFVCKKKSYSYTPSLTVKTQL